MMWLLSVWVTALVLSVSAQDETGTRGSTTRTSNGIFLSTPGPSPNSMSEHGSESTSDAVETHTINVGAAGHKFTPDQTIAKVGDVLEYRFYPKEHWVIRGDFDHPCIPYEYVSTNRKGFSSGAQAVEAILEDGPRFRVTVNDTEPIFFYCGAPGSCVNWNMVGVVNPSGNMTLQDHIQKAREVEYQLVPGEPWPGEGDPNSDDGSSTGGSDSDSDGGSSLGTGAIAGIAVGAGIAVIGAAAFCFFFGRRRRNRRPHGNVRDPANHHSQEPMTEPYGYRSSPGSELWSHGRFSFGKHSSGIIPRYSTPGSTATGTSHSPMPGSPHSGYHYQFAPVAPGELQNTSSYYDPRASPTPQYMPHPAAEQPRQDRPPPVELPTVTESEPETAPAQRPAEEARFSWARGSEQFSNQTARSSR